MIITLCIWCISDVTKILIAPACFFVRFLKIELNSSVPTSDRRIHFLVSSNNRKEYSRIIIIILIIKWILCMYRWIYYELFASTKKMNNKEIPSTKIEPIIKPKCNLFELVQYQCIIKDDRVICSPFVRIFKRY